MNMTRENAKLIYLLDDDIMRAINNNQEVKLTKMIDNLRNIMENEDET